LEGERLTERISQKIFDVLGKAAARSQRAVICASPPLNVPPRENGIAANAKTLASFDLLPDFSALLPVCPAAVNP
jgi:hypothetical protein